MKVAIEFQVSGENPNSGLKIRRVGGRLIRHEFKQWIEM